MGALVDTKQKDKRKSAERRKMLLFDFLDLFSQSPAFPIVAGHQEEI
jgi:hypothetical protein